MNQFEEDAGGQSVSNDGLFEVQNLASLMIGRQTEIEDLMKIVGEKQKEIERIEQDLLPTLMKELGISEFTLMDGQKIEVTEDFAVSITKAKQEACFEWLRNHNLGDIIKTEVKAKFGRGEEDLSRDVLKTLFEMGVQEFDHKSSVHSGTLKAQVRELLKSEQDTPEEDRLPRELFSMYEYSRAKITKPKKGKKK